MLPVWSPATAARPQVCWGLFPGPGTHPPMVGPMCRVARWLAKPSAPPVPSRIGLARNVTGPRGPMRQGRGRACGRRTWKSVLRGGDAHLRPAPTASPYRTRPAEESCLRDSPQSAKCPGEATMAKHLPSDPRWLRWTWGVKLDGIRCLLKQLCCSPPLPWVLFVLWTKIWLLILSTLPSSPGLGRRRTACLRSPSPLSVPPDLGSILCHARRMTVLPSGSIHHGYS